MEYLDQINQIEQRIKQSKKEYMEISIPEEGMIRMKAGMERAKQEKKKGNKQEGNKQEGNKQEGNKQEEDEQEGDKKERNKKEGDRMKGIDVWFGVLSLTGVVFFLWFCWPLVFKGILNAGNGCGMLGAAVLILYGVRHRTIHQFLMYLWQRRMARVCLAVLAVFILIGTVLAAAAAAAVVRAGSKNIPANTPAVLLGCSVMGTKPSRVLRERLDAAYVYLQDHPNAVCILSGGQGRDEDISEAECMYRELVKAGIDADRLYQEPESINTQENLAYSKKILDNLGLTDAVTIISSDFHLYRGRYWGKTLGFQTYGFALHTDWRYLPTFFLREVIAVVHLWLSELLP